MNLTNRRRRLTVARRDPMIQQRQYFANRRERNQRNARQTQARQALNSFRRPERAPTDKRDAAALEQPLPLGTDYLLLANPSANDSIIADIRRPKHPPLEELRRARPERTEHVQPEPVQDLDLEVSNDIRIFDHDVERTHQFRRRTLPDDFLNSQITGNDRQRRRQGAEEHSRNATLGKRARLDCDPRNERERVARRICDPSPLPSPSLIRMDRIVDMREPSRREDLMPDTAYRHEVLSPKRQRRQMPSKRFRSPTSSPLHDRAVTSRFEEDEFVEATLSDDERKNVYKDFLFGISPNVQNGTQSRLPTATKLLSTLTAITPHFPAVKVDSESSESLNKYRPTKSEEKYKFRSLLCNEEITSGQFSANVQELERKLLNLPDLDVPFLSVSKTLAGRKKTKSNIRRSSVSPDVGLKAPKESATKAFCPAFDEDVTHVEMKTSLGALPRKKQAFEEEKAKRCDQIAENEANMNPKSKNGGSLGMEVAVVSDARNPVTLAADGAVSEMTTRNG